MNFPIPEPLVSGPMKSQDSSMNITFSEDVDPEFAYRVINDNLSGLVVKVFNTFQYVYTNEVEIVVADSDGLHVRETSATEWYGTKPATRHGDVYVIPWANASKIHVH